MGDSKKVSRRDLLKSMLKGGAALGTGGALLGGIVGSRTADGQAEKDILAKRGDEVLAAEAETNVQKRLDGQPTDVRQVVSELEKENAALKVERESEIAKLADDMRPRNIAGGALGFGIVGTVIGAGAAADTVLEDAKSARVNPPSAAPKLA